MKIRIKLEADDPFRKELENIGIEDDPNADYVLTKRVDITNYIKVKEDQQYYISDDDILYIESMGHDILVHTDNEVYHSGSRLKQWEADLDGEDFLRISNSCIISLRAIKRIKTSVFQKFSVELVNGEVVDVTRSYYYIFKEKVGI